MVLARAEEETDGCIFVRLSMIAMADLKRIFGADKTEVTAELNEKILEPRNQALVQFALAMAGREIEILDHIGVFEYSERLRMGFCEGGGRLWRVEHAPFKECCLELALKLAFGPSLFYCHAEIKFAFV